MLFRLSCLVENCLATIGVCVFCAVTSVAALFILWRNLEMKKIIATILTLTIFISILSGCKNNTDVLSSISEQNFNDRPLIDNDVTVNADGTIITDTGEILSKDEYTIDDNGNIITNDNKVVGNVDTNKKPSTGTNSRPQNTTQNQNNNNSTSSNSSQNTTQNQNNSQNNKPLIFYTIDNLFGEETTLTEEYLIPSTTITDFNKNSTNIYENKYVKIDATKSNKGCIFITYKDIYASKITVILDMFTPYGGYSQGNKIIDYTKADFANDKELMIALPIEDAMYCVSVLSTINDLESTKLYVDLDRVTFDGTASYEYIYPSEEAIQLKQTSTGVYSNDYVSINTNTANKGYVDIDYKDKYGYDISVEISTNVKNQYGNYGRWHYNTSNKGPCNIKAALTYGNVEYTISVYSSIINEKTNVGGCTKKGQVTVKLNNVSETSAFLMNCGEVRYNFNMQFIKKANELASGCKNDLEKVSKIYDWLTNYISYGLNDEEPSLGFYTCDLDKIYNSKKGVCYDYSVVLAAMLRSQGIPCKVVFGKYSNSDSGLGHTWNEIYVSEAGTITTNKLSITGNKWCRLDPTFSKDNSGNSAIQFMQNDTNYTWQYYY